MPFLIGANRRSSAANKPLPLARPRKIGFVQPHLAIQRRKFPERLVSFLHFSHSARNAPIANLPHTISPHQNTLLPHREIKTRPRRTKLEVTSPPMPTRNVFPSIVVALFVSLALTG